MNYLVTGATGFIGSQLAIRLAGNGHYVRALCRNSADTRVLQDHGIDIVRGDIRCPTDVQEAMKHCEYVYHLAGYAKNWAKNPNTFYEVNVNGVKNILRIARQSAIKKIVVTSTSLVFGPSNGVAVSEAKDIPQELYTDYVRTKALAEIVISSFDNGFTEVVVVNPTRVFGPGLLTEGNSVCLMIKDYLAGMWRTIPGNGQAIGNYAYVDDVVNGHLLAMTNGQHGKRYILGGANLSFDEFFKELAEAAGTKYHMFHIPGGIAKFFAHLELLRAEYFKHYPLITPEWVDLFLDNWAFSSDNAKNELGYQITPFRDALNKTIQWLAKNGVSQEEGILQ